MEGRKRMKAPNMSSLDDANHISKLDASMVRCGVVYMFSYRFTGTVQHEVLTHSIDRVVNAIPRFRHLMKTDAGYQGHWQEQTPDMPLLVMMENDDIDQAFEDYYQQLSQTDQDALAPMFFVLIKRKAGDNFMILQCGKHSYCDGGSATFVFNQMIDYYNAMIQGCSDVMQVVLDNVSALTSPAPRDIFSLGLNSKRKLIDIGNLRHVKNTVKLLTYKTCDETRYATPHAELQSMLAAFRDQTSAPIMRCFDVHALIEHCGRYFPAVSPNSMVCALIAKAFHLHKRDTKKALNSPNISFRMMVDILTPPMRKKYIGNYIAYLPVTVYAPAAIHDIANVINHWLFDAKQKRADISMYKLLEFALGSGMANKTNDPVSYIIANISNTRLSSNPGLMHNATCNEFRACANSAPVDLGGAQLNNRPTLCFNLNSSGQLYVGFFNTLTDREVGWQILDNVQAVLEGSVG